MTKKTVIITATILAVVIEVYSIICSIKKEKEEEKEIEKMLNSDPLVRSMLLAEYGRQHYKTEKLKTNKDKSDSNERTQEYLS